MIGERWRSTFFVVVLNYVTWSQLVWFLNARGKQGDADIIILLPIYQVFLILTCTLSLLPKHPFSLFCGLLMSRCLFALWTLCAWFAGGASLCCPIACWQGEGAVQLGMCRAINTLPLVLLRQMAARYIGLYLIRSFSLNI